MLGHRWKFEAEEINTRRRRQSAGTSPRRKDISIGVRGLERETASRVRTIPNEVGPTD